MTLSPLASTAYFSVPSVLTSDPNLGAALRERRNVLTVLVLLLLLLLLRLFRHCAKYDCM